MASTIVLARNTAPESRNPIHTEEARRHGFSGGIVPGLTLFAYAFREPLHRWGEPWLGAGEATMAFKQPVYDGDDVVIGTTERDGSSGDVLEVELTVAGRGLCASGWFQRRLETARPWPASFPSGGSPPDPLPPVDDEQLRTCGPLPPLSIDTSPTAVGQWLAAHDETDPTFERVLHPALLSRVSARMLPLRFRFDGPRVHRRLHASFFATRPQGPPLTARGRVTRVWSTAATATWPASSPWSTIAATR